MNDKNYVPLELRAPITVPELLRLMDINADMLAALRQIREFDALTHDQECRGMKIIARAAIAKAEGK